MTEAQRTYIREYYREYRKRHRAKINARQKLAIRMKTNPERAELIEEAKTYYRGAFPPIDGVIINDDKSRLKIFYSRDGKRYSSEIWFESPDDCAIHHIAIRDLMKEG